jgi:ATP-dependent DNA helicase RecG
MALASGASNRMREQHGLLAPVFEESQQGFRVILFKHSVDGGVSTPEDLVLLITQQPGLNVVELVQLCGKPQRTVERWLQQLKNEQKIEFRGAPKTGGYYVK